MTTPSGAPTFIHQADVLHRLEVGQRVRDRMKDIWTKQPDGIWTTPETAPFSAEHIIKKWGPVELLDEAAFDAWLARFAASCQMSDQALPVDQSGGDRAGATTGADR